jgi:rubrerythrin
MSETLALQDLLGCLVELERAGQRMYTALARENVRDPALYKLFGDLSAWEKRHEELYAGYVKQFSGDAAVPMPASDPDYLAYLHSLVQSAMCLMEFSRKPITNTVDVLYMALQLEKDTVLFLNEVIPHVPQNSAAAAAFQAVMTEEKRHVTTIQALLAHHVHG